MSVPVTVLCYAVLCVLGRYFTLRMCRCGRSWSEFLRALLRHHTHTHTHTHTGWVEFCSGGDALRVAIFPAFPLVRSTNVDGHVVGEARAQKKNQKNTGSERPPSGSN
ncbi:hypothetical protein LZ31DRAFT_548130, partial [Colletotrichum somersetense]